MGEGERNGEAWVRTRGEAETGWRTTARGRKTAEEEGGRRGHDAQVSSDIDRGERRGDGQGESKAKREGWSGGSEGDSDEETEEDRMAEGDLGGSGDTLTASPWGT